MSHNLGNRTWVVFLVGLSSLLALLFVPSVTALRRTERVYEEILQLQRAREETERTLREIEREMYVVSIRLREFLLDNSPEADGPFRTSVAESRGRIESQVRRLRRQSPEINNHPALQALEEQLAAYWAAIDPVFEWTPGQRDARATYFLREQQRPRRENLVAIADELARLADTAYQHQYQGIERTERAFRTDIERGIALAFVLGSVIAVVTILRVHRLELQAAAQQAATEQAEERMRHLSTQLMHAQEEERASLARELHDEVGQMLTALRMELGMLERLRESPGEFGERLRESKGLAEQTLRSVRNLAVGLRPSVLDLGLAPALHSQAREISRRFDVTVDVRVEGDLEDLPEAHKTCFYRVAQESLTNVVRHASARHVEVAVRRTGQVVDLHVWDDGRGFVVGPATAGVGLVGMEERVRELGGTLRVESEPDKGTLIEARLVLPS